MFTVSGKNTMLDNFGITQYSLHSAYSTTGANELSTSTGSPALRARERDLRGGCGGSKAASTQPVFNVYTGAIVAWLGKWIGATFAGMEPVNSTEREFFVDPSTDVFTCYGHGYVNTDQVAFYGDTIPIAIGLTEGAHVFIRDATTDTFKVEPTVGGGAFDVTAVPGRGLRGGEGDPADLLLAGHRDHHRLAVRAQSLRCRSPAPRASSFSTGRRRPASAGCSSTPTGRPPTAARINWR